jgi:hypothetical protein
MVEPRVLNAPFVEIKLKITKKKSSTGAGLEENLLRWRTIEARAYVTLWVVECPSTEGRNASESEACPSTEGYTK